LSNSTNRWLSKALQGFLHSVSAVVGTDSNDDLNVVYIDNNGVLRVNLRDASGTPINPATEETVSQLVLTITNALDFVAFDLNAAAFSEITAITDDYTLDSVELNFSTAEAKTITVTSEDGTILWGGDVDQTAANQGYLSTAKNIYLDFNQRSFKSGDNITVAVTQFGSAGTMDCILKTKTGSNSLLGTPNVKVVDDAGNIYQDAIRSRCMPTVDIDHFFTHAGANFQNSDTDTVGDLEFKDFLMITPAEEIHLINFHFTSSQANAEIVLYEEPTTSDNGDPLTLFNKKRTSVNTADTLLYEDPTVSAVGEQLEHDLIVGGKQSGGNSFSETGDEWVIKPSTKYLIRYNNKSNQDDLMDWKIGVLEPAQV
jgi:hypothetical protein